jgi:signal transduction histidine kinase
VFVQLTVLVLLSSLSTRYFHRGEGDLHDKRYDRFRHTEALIEKELYTETSPTYILHVYPNGELYEVYQTGNAVTASVGAVCAILITSLVFFLYDFFVRREFNAKKELLEAKRQFMRFVSHEVRTPLNSVCLGLTIVENDLARSLGYDSPDCVEIDLKKLDRATTSSTTDGKDINADYNQTLDWFSLTQEIKTNAQGAVDVLNDLLNYDKIERGTFRLELELVPIWNLIEQTLAEFRASAAEKKIQYDDSFSTQERGKAVRQVARSQELPQEARELKLVGDSLRVMQVLRNLISNGLKFTPEGGSLRVHASWVVEEGNVAGRNDAMNTVELSSGQSVSAQRRGFLQVQVEDSGAGLSSDQVAQLFSDGIQFNVNKLQAGQGSGLGLFITMGIVEQHEGTLVAASEGLGQGTTFTMTLPLWDVPQFSSACSVSTSEEDSNRGTVAPSSLRVLVVDDVRSNRRLLSHLLRKGGHISEEAEDGAEAVDMVARAIEDGAPFDSVLMVCRFVRPFPNLRADDPLTTVVFHHFACAGL